VINRAPASAPGLRCWRAGGTSTESGGHRARVAEYAEAGGDHGAPGGS
jgi:hypothetical protein